MDLNENFARDVSVENLISSGIFMVALIEKNYC